MLGHTFTLAVPPCAPGPDRGRLRYASRVEPAAQQLLRHLMAAAPHSDREGGPRAVRDAKLHRVGRGKRAASTASTLWGHPMGLTSVVGHTSSAGEPASDVVARGTRK